jgi:DNA-directed RNA polymerase subunit M/transcription elongation factor TFIIS
MSEPKMCPECGECLSYTDAYGDRFYTCLNCGYDAVGDVPEKEEE